MYQFNAQKLAAVAIAQSFDATRYYLNGVYLHGDTAVATDGHMLTKAIETDPELENPKDGAIFPVSKKAITAMKKNTAAKVTFENDVLTVLDETESVLHLEPSKQIDGTFPDYNRVIPDGDFESSLGGFAPDLLIRLSNTAKILISGPLVLTGEDASSPHKVKYVGSSDVMSVIMPMRQ